MTLVKLTFLSTNPQGCLKLYFCVIMTPKLSSRSHAWMSYCSSCFLLIVLDHGKIFCGNTCRFVIMALDRHQSLSRNISVFCAIKGNKLWNYLFDLNWRRIEKLHVKSWSHSIEENLDFVGLTFRRHLKIIRMRSDIT